MAQQQDENALFRALSTHLIKQGEGFRPDVYKDHRGNRTIGHGFNLDDPFIHRYLPPLTSSITEEQSTNILGKILDEYVGIARNYVGGDVFDKLNTDQRAVLTDMAYNLGGPRLAKFQGLRKALLEGDYERAGAEIIDSHMHRDLDRIRAGRDFEIRTERNRDLMSGKTTGRFKPIQEAK